MKTKATFTLSFAQSEVSLHKYDPYSVVSLERGAPVGKPGEPALPCRRCYVSVPRGAVLEDISAKALVVSTLAHEITVHPCQPHPIRILGMQVPWVPPDPLLYGSDVRWPERPVRAMGIRQMGGFPVAELEVCPFQYEFRSQTLDLIEQLEVVLTYTLQEVLEERPRSLAFLRAEQKFAKRLEALVVNPELVSSHRQITDETQLLDFTEWPPINYVIVTTHALAEAFQRLAQWRTQMGLNARVVTVEDIKAGTVPDTGGAVFWHTSGYHDGGTRDRAEAIRNFIKWAAFHWLTEYVLLGGDTMTSDGKSEIIPCRQVVALGWPDNTVDDGGRDWFITYSDLSNPDTRPDKQKIGKKPITASTERAGMLADYVIDGKADTFWQCAPDDGDPWLELTLNFDVDPTPPINFVRLNWGAKYATAYELLVCNATGQWTSVYTTSSGSGGSQEIKLSPVCAGHLRLRITSGTDFALAEIGVYGPARGSAYRFKDTLTRILSSTIPRAPDPSKSNEDNLKDKKALLIIAYGPKAGTVIPYCEASQATELGWHFVEDFLEIPGRVKQDATLSIEINGPSEYHGQSMIWVVDDEGGVYFPADLYYSDIAASEYTSTDRHDWDYDGNHVYGERYGENVDRVNGIADIRVGRAPVETPADAVAFINKVIRYEKFITSDGSLLPMDFAVSILLCSANLGAKVSGSLDLGTYTNEAIKRWLQGPPATDPMAPPRWLFTRRYEDYLHVPPEDQGPDLAEGNHDTMVAALRTGHNGVSLVGHGNSGETCCSYNSGQCFLKSEDFKEGTLVNYPGIFFAQACNNGMFDIEEAISEWAILNPTGGAVAFIGESRMGPVEYRPTAEVFWKALPSSERIGEMFETAMLHLANRWICVSFNLLGDPAMRVWSNRPQQLTVSHPQKIYAGRQLLEVTVSSASGPVKDALVCATMQGTLFATATSDQSGQASLDIMPTLGGTLHLTVSGKNLIPYLGTVSVEPSCNYIGTWLVLGPIFDPAHQLDGHSDIREQDHGHPWAGDIIRGIDDSWAKSLTTIGSAPGQGAVVSYRGSVFAERKYVWRVMTFSGVNWMNYHDFEDNIHKHLSGDYFYDPYDIFDYLNFDAKHHALALFLVYIACPDENSRHTELCIRSDDAIRVWLNGSEIEELKWENEKDIRDYTEVCASITLNSGPNVLLCAVAETHVEWGFSARIKHDEGLVFSTVNPNRLYEGIPLSASEHQYISIVGSSDQWEADKPNFKLDTNRVLFCQGGRTWKGRVVLFDEEFKFYADGNNLHSWGKTGYNTPGGNFTLSDFGIVPGIYDVIFEEYGEWRPGNPTFIFVKPFRWRKT